SLYLLGYYLLHCTYLVRVFFFIATATTEIYTLSLHDALPIFGRVDRVVGAVDEANAQALNGSAGELAVLHRLLDPFVDGDAARRSEEHTSELQSRENLVCRLLLEKKKKKNKRQHEIE